MKKVTFKAIQLLKIAFFISVFISCSKEEVVIDSSDNSDVTLKATANPSWKVDARCFYNGASGTFDYISVKDPSIVYYGSKWHLFYTGMNAASNGSWRTGYASASSISGLSSSSHTMLSALSSGYYYCAPQVFYFTSKGKWYLICQSGLGASYSTNTSISNTSGWTSLKTMGFSDGIDFWCISDGTNVYCFYSAQDGSYTIKRRSTTVANFPTGWGSASVVATNTFEAVHVYKNKADSKYYMMVEDITRHFELWTASSLSGTWTKVSEEWAANSDLTFNADDWTDQVSHGEILRSSYTELLEIDNIDKCQVLFQGVVNGSYSTYAGIPYDLGLMRNY
jgi:hypothetical protein